MSMRLYELMIILDPEIEERTVAPSLDKYLTVVTTEGGSVDKVDIWGRRRLAYDINKKSEGIYAVIDFTATPATAKELDRQLGLNEVVLRTKVMRREESKVAAVAADETPAEAPAEEAADAS